MRWFNLNTGIIILVIIIILFIILYAIGIGIVGYSLWDVPKAKELIPFLEISEAFPTKVIALFTVLLAGATFLLALATFGTILQNYIFRREDRNRERIVRSAEELYRWMEEALRLFYLPYNYHKDEIYFGLIGLVSKNIDSTAAAIIVGNEFVGLVKRATYALTNYFSAIKIRRQEHKQVDESILEEFKTSFEGLHFYLNLLRSWDYKYGAFLKEARAHSKLPLSENLEALEQ